MKRRAVIERILHNWPVKIMSVTAAVLLFFFYRVSSLEERFFNVPLDIKIQDNFIPADSYPETVRVTLRGNEEDIRLVLEDEIEAWVDFSGHDEEGRFREPVQIARKGFATGINRMEIRVEPMELNLTLEEKMVRSLPVVPTVVGFPEKGYELVQYFITPSSVEIYGGRSKVEALEEIHTEDIDVSSRISDFTTRVRLRKSDPSITFSGGDIVEFTASIKEITVVRNLSGLDVIALDLDSTLQIGSFQGINSIKVQGKQLEFEKYLPDDFRFTVDCSTLSSPGTYDLPVVPDVPAGILVLNYEPKEITVEISSAGE